VRIPVALLSLFQEKIRRSREDHLDIVSCQFVLGGTLAACVRVALAKLCAVAAGWALRTASLR
jgi:hypothetical protein